MSKRGRLFRQQGMATLSIVTALGWQLLAFLLILLRPDLHPFWQTISEWAIGPFGWLMQLGFLLSATSYCALFWSVRSAASGKLGQLGLGFLIICAIGTIGVGIFVTDPMPITPAKGLTTHGALHVLLGGTALLLLPFAALGINLSLARDPRWAASRRVLLGTAFLPLAALGLSVIHLVLVVLPMGENAYGPGVALGWPARVVFLCYSIWVITLATQFTKEQHP